jgi:uncharacterized protein (DUF2147 family)
MKSIILIICLLITTNINSQNIVGNWKILDENNDLKSVVQIYEDNQVYYGKIVLVTYDNVCTTCIGKYKDKDIVDEVILKDLKKQDDSYENGKITDPENGKTYSCYVKLIKPNKLKLRGFIGFSLFGRTEYWYRVSEQEEREFKKITKPKQR